MFMAQIGCAAIGVIAFTLLGPGWLSRGASLAASIAFMIYTKSTHPPGNLYFYICFVSLIFARQNSCKRWSDIFQVVELIKCNLNEKIEGPIETKRFI